MSVPSFFCSTQRPNHQHTAPYTASHIAKSMPTSRAKITLKDEELVKMLQTHQGALLQIQSVEKDQQTSLEAKLKDLLLEMCKKTARMSHKVLASALKKAKLMKIDVEATSLKLIHAWANVLEKEDWTGPRLRKHSLKHMPLHQAPGQEGVLCDHRLEGQINELRSTPFQEQCVLSQN